MPLQQRLQDWLDSRCSRHLIGCSRSGNTLAPTGSSCSSLLPNHLKPKQRLQQKNFIRLLTSRVDSHSATWLHLKADKHMTPKHTKNKLNNTSIIQSFLLRFQPRTMHKSVIFCKAIRSCRWSSHNQLPAKWTEGLRRGIQLLRWTETRTGFHQMTGRGRNVQVWLTLRLSSD